MPPFSFMQKPETFSNSSTANHSYLDLGKKIVDKRLELLDFLLHVSKLLSQTEAVKIEPAPPTTHHLDVRTYT